MVDVVAVHGLGVGRLLIPAIVPLPAPAVLMLQRISLVAAIVLACGSNQGLSEPFSGRPAPGLDAVAPMAFYVVKGAPDACGLGCDRWIAVEGQADSKRHRVFQEIFVEAA